MRQPSGRELGRFRRPRRRLRAGLVQLLCMLAGLGLGLLLPRISTGSSVASTRVTEALVTIGFGTLGLVSVIFSLLFLVVQWAFGSLSPRLNLFRDDPVVWRTFGVALGVFVFSVTSALVIANDQQVSVVVPAVEVAAVLLTIALMRVLQVRAFGPGAAHHPAEYCAATAPAVDRVAAPARPRSHGRQLPGDLARRRRARPRMSTGRKPITTKAAGPAA